ncbi:hypothetical protein PBY51_004612 [Eleginops maclovinus]|uniref:Uncharacterized protein n=1 Tax=Eleginops maclovinus TaxID=56733 RepID=A0AAN8AQT9_ELEMC|nr:hypothetical protein PBY51_004612 [Eleginops maclovinus]
MLQTSLFRLILPFDAICEVFRVVPAADYSALSCKPTRFLSTPRSREAPWLISSGWFPHSVLLLLLFVSLTRFEYQRLYKKPGAASCLGARQPPASMWFRRSDSL